jgi:hypothetical protein
MKTILGAKCPEMSPVQDSLLNHFSTVCNRELERFEMGGDLPAELDALIKGSIYE